MATLVPNKLWNEIEPLLPKRIPSPKGDDRRFPTGLAQSFVLGGNLEHASLGNGLRQWRDVLATARESGPA